MATVAFDDVAKELEWQKTNLALGQPVDAELLIEMCGQLQRENDGLRREYDEAKKELAASEESERDLESEVGELTERVKELEEKLAKKKK